jgi:hypothetical protein
MRRLACTLAAACLLALTLAGPAQAAFGINNFKLAFTEADGSPAPAGSHPFAFTTSLGTDFNNETLIPEGWLKDIFVKAVPGLAADFTAYPRCTTAEFLARNPEGGGEPLCSLTTQVGIVAVAADAAGSWETHPIYNLSPPPGVLLRLGFRIATESIFIDASLSQSPPYVPLAASRNTPQLKNVFGSKIQLWGNPSDPRHDELRGECGSQGETLEPGDIEGFEFQPTGKSCPVVPRPKPFLTMPTDCSGPLFSSFEAVSWEGEVDSGSYLFPALAGCGTLRAFFHPQISARPTSRAAHSPTGLDFSIDVEDEGLTSVGGLAQPDIKKMVTTLPEGVTANPSLAEGLEVCSESDLERETLQAAPGEGCPQASKIGTLEVESPLVEEPIDGDLYVATPHANLADDSLISFYVVFKNPKLGVIVKQPVKVEPDPKTGQLIATADEIPQLPFSHFRLHFREGGRSPLVSPPLCGDYQAKAVMTPRSGGAPFTATSAFRIISGPNESTCPKGGTPPFNPSFEAGSQNNAAGHYSPFSMRLTRRDGDQDLVRFDATLPSGVSAKLAGVSQCSDAQIALAKAKTGIAELRNPSCPADSRIGGVIGGAGVGSQLTYVPGSIYLAGPVSGAPASVVAIVPAVAGPFDVGTVVVREALRIDPRTGQATADGAHSDPLPHILAGIPLLVREIQVHVDRQNFSLNPTACSPLVAKASIWGGGINPFSILDDSPVAREARYQAASCASLGFRPRLGLKLIGGSRRGDFPRFRFTYRPRPGDANLQSLQLHLPHSEFVEQGHFRTICTRVQYAAGAGNGAACPGAAIYGHARVFTPILDQPVEGPVYLRSSNHNLPDIVLALQGPPSLPVHTEVVARIDSIHGGLRATSERTPDLPVTKAVVDMLGGAKGLIVNSTNLCARRHRVNVRLDAHNGKQFTIDPMLQAISCNKKLRRR